MDYHVLLQQNELHVSCNCIWYSGSKKRGKRCSSRMWHFWSVFSEEKIASYFPINKTHMVMERQQRQFPLVGKVLHAGFGNIMSPPRKKTVGNLTVTSQTVMPSHYCVAPPGYGKECLKMRSYPNLKSAWEWPILYCMHGLILKEDYC